MFERSKFNSEYFTAKSPEISAITRHTGSVDEFRTSLANLAHQMMFEAFDEYDAFSDGSIRRVRDCVRVSVRMMIRRSEEKANFSVAGAIMDIAHGRARTDEAVFNVPGLG